MNRCGNPGTEAPAAGAEAGGHDTEGLGDFLLKVCNLTFHCLIRQVAQHGMPFTEFLHKRRRVPRMAMSANFAVLARNLIEEKLPGRPVLYNWVRNEVGRNGAVGVEDLLHAGQHLKRLQRKSRRSILAPVVLFGVNGDEESGHRLGLDALGMPMSNFERRASRSLPP